MQGHAYAHGQRPLHGPLHRREGVLQGMPTANCGRPRVYCLESVQGHFQGGVADYMDANPPVKVVGLFNNSRQVFLAGERKSSEIGVVGVGRVEVATFHATVQGHLQAPDIQPLAISFALMRQPLDPPPPLFGRHAQVNPPHQRGPYRLLLGYHRLVGFNLHRGQTRLPHPGDPGAVVGPYSCADSRAPVFFAWLGQQPGKSRECRTFQ